MTALFEALVGGGLPIGSARTISREPPQVDLVWSRPATPAEAEQAAQICAAHGVQVLVPQQRGQPWIRQAAPPQGMPDESPTESAPVFTVDLHSNGIGDSLLGLAVAEGLRTRWQGPIALCGQRRHYPWLELFAGADALLTGPAPGPTYICDLDGYGRTDRSTPRWNWWARRAGVAAALPPYQALPPAAMDWAVLYAGRICIAPFAQHANRTWPLARWLTVERLLLEKGFLCVVLDDRQGRCDDFRSPKILAETPARVAAVIDQAAAFVGNDSGLAHVAGFLRTPAAVVASRASDTGIMDLYPTHRTLGGRASGFHAVSPEAVVRAVLSLVRESAGDFPAGRFSEIILERDLWRIHAWLPVYATLWQVARRLRPRRIVEIGCRAGYSAWVFRQALLTVHVHSIDADLPEDLPEASGGFQGAHQHARQINPDRWDLEIADSHALRKLPPADLVYIDGDHSEAGCYADLLLAERSGAPAILVDDIVNCPPVRTACARFLRERPHLTWEFHPNLTGHLLIQGKQ